MTATTTSTLRTPRPCVDEVLRKTIIADTRAGIVDLWENSPTRVEDNHSHTESIIDALFPADSMLCVGRSRSQFQTASREKLRGRLHTMQFIVPSPMRAAWGRTREGKRSAHTLDNTGPRRFIVTEFDYGTIDEQAALILHLSYRAPLTLVVHSGNKSLHAWFYCLGQPEDRVHEFFKHAVGLGADPATWGRSQFTRMPDGRRDNGRQQKTFYLNPATVKQ
ncbi:MAG: hypothetical protein ABIR71_09355 [Chthoniobacterales bacterium]